ncbi:hypothetical protein H2201_005887 [Coniosporium apollinis]|uniref:DUF676 domain-containing protein n=1 Tax=Coniosporium apollinis TaxID=61459 RepID=A0ABQ9NNG0_9PEZI|nr:hypothetical protein H2201_005887 [Coniosporium apollinis]
METAPSASSTADHLCVLVHGLWGNPSHLKYLATALRENHPEDKLHILVAKRNSGSFTYDGIELGGERVTREIEETLEELARNGQTIKKLSVVGYSLGGLVARYAIGLLYHNGWFDKLEPVNFTTFATPHLGVRTPLNGYHNHIWNVLGARTLSTSGRQLFTIDSFRDTGRPLLSVLADPDSVFIKALAKFKHRSLYANVVNDRSAVYYTTGISRTDPFVDTSALKINYVKGYEPVVIDPDNPVSPKENRVLPSFTQRLAGTSKTALSKVPLAAFLVLFIPVGAVLFLSNSLVQSFLSRKRIRLHEEGKAGIGAGMYRIPLMARAERVFENMNHAQSSEYLPAGGDEHSSSASSPQPVRRQRKSSSQSVEKDASGAEETDASAPFPTQAQKLEFPTLALTKEQFEMIEALDAVGWRKYPVYIHNVAHSHAAIIVRRQMKMFDEGKIVVRHWLSEFEV